MIFEKLKALLSHKFEVEESVINPDTRLIEDLGADSLDVVDLVEAVQDEFEVEVKDEDIEGIKTVKDMMVCISNLLEA